ncbi:MAG: Ig-like domain-containing protein [Verrucomicrobiota bacterium]
MSPVFQYSGGAIRRFLPTVVSSFLLMFPARAQTPDFPPGLRIMPLGDSITYGYNGSNAGYRGPLYSLLSPLAADFRFVGSSSERPGFLPSIPIDQRKHEGHSSYLIQDVFNNLDGFDNARFLQYGGPERDPNGGYWLTGGNGTGREPLFPDIITMMIGTTEVGNMNGVETRLRNLITKITTLRPAAKLFVAKIIPMATGQSVAPYNVIVTNVVADFQAQGKNIYLVDMNTGFPFNGLDPDAVHPNNIGFNWMASRWFEAITAAYTVNTHHPYSGSPVPIPGTVQAEDFDNGGENIAYHDLSPTNQGGQYRTNEGVDIDVTGDEGGGYHVFDTQTGEWLKFTANIAASGDHTLNLRVSNSAAGGVVHLESDGLDVSGPIGIPLTGGPDAWQTVTVPGISLGSGVHTLRLVVDGIAPNGSAGAINWLALTAEAMPGPAANAGPDQQIVDLDNNGSENATLDASASVAGSAPIASISWLKHGVAIASGINPTLPLATGNHIIQLKVTDSSGLEGSDEILITVRPRGFVNGSFESNFTSWAAMGNILMQSGSPYAPTDGTKLVGFNGANTLATGVLSQSFATVPGATYALTYDAGVVAFNTNPQTMQATVTGTGNLFSRTTNMNGIGGGINRWHPQSATFVADSAMTTLTFRDQSAFTNSIDMTLDNVRVTGPPPEIPNTAPRANADSYSIGQDNALVVPTGGVLANDRDDDSNPLTVVPNAGPGHGTLTLNLNGSFTYTPTSGFFGTDAFSYHANDGKADSNVTTVSLTVIEYIPPPVAVADAYVTNESTALAVPAAGVLANDSDSRSRPLTALINTRPVHGSLVLNADGGFIYTPITGFFGTDSFTYHARHGTSNSEVVTVALTVNEVIPAPMAAPESYLTDENVPLEVPAAGVLANDADLRSRPLSAFIEGGTSHGTISLNGDGSFTYTPQAGFFGTDSFTYVANNGFSNSGIVTVTLIVNEVIPPPVAAANSYVMNENGMLLIPAAGVLANDMDPRSRPLTAVIDAGPSHGLFAMNADGGFVYTPNANYFGVDSFTYHARNGFLNSDVVTVHLTVNEVIPPPVAVAESYVTNENTALVISASGVLANDSDPRARPLTAIVDAAPSHGTLNLNPNGSFVYTPVAGFFGTDSFTYHARNGFLNSGIVTVTLTINEVIPPPLAVADTHVTNENLILFVPAAGVLSNDADPRSRPLTAVLDEGPSHGFLAMDADGGFVYTPAAGYYGSDAFTYHAHNGFLDSDVVTVTIAVNEVIPPPAAALDSYVTNENATLVVPAKGVLSNDSDPRARPLTAVLDSGPAHGSVILNANGSFTYTPANNYFGTDSFTYHARNGFLNSGTVTVTLTINEVIPPPVAVTDSYSTEEDIPLVVPASGVLANDSDPRARALTAVLDAGPSHGTLGLNADGSFAYSPADGFFGSDSFTYHARNGFLNSGIVTVSLTVNEYIPPPVVQADSYVTNENTPLTVPAAGVLANDSDPGSRPLTVALDDEPSHGTLSLNANGGFTYAPVAGFFGTDAFTYHANNGHVDSDVVTVTLTVNEVIPPPVAVADSYVTNENTALVVPASGVLANDSDPRARPLTAIRDAGPGHGTLALNANGSFTYTPVAGFFGTDSFSYHARNGFLNSGITVVSITINEVIPPPVAVADSYSTNENVALVIPAAGVLANDSDPRARPLTAVLDAGPGHGTLNLNANGNFTYTPAASFFGTDSFTYHARNGFLNSGVVTVTITINEVIPPPVAVDDSYSTNENVALVIPLSGVLANDSDPRARPLTAVLDSGPAHGSLSLNANGSFTYTPTNGYFGADSFTYHARNGFLNSGVVTVTIAVKEVIPPPVAVADSYSTNENVALVIPVSGVLANDSDPRARPLTAVLDAGPSHGTLTLNASGNFTYTPTNGYFGTDSFTYHARNGFLNSGIAVVSITINEVIPPPVAVADSYSMNENVALVIPVAGVLANDSDPRARPLTAVLDSGPAHGNLSLNANGSFTYTPANGYFGTDSFTYHARNGFLNSGTVTVTLVINEVIPPPVAVADSYATNENTALVIPASGVLANDSDPRARPLTAVAGAGPSHGTFSLNSNGSFVYTPAAGFFGTDSFTYRSHNGTLSSPLATVSITINEVIPPPVAAADSYSTNESTALVVPAAGVLANDSDPRARPLAAVLDTSPLHGSLILNANGSFIYTPAGNYFGADSFTYHARNGFQNSGIVTVSLIINETVPPPVAAADAYATNESTTLVIPAAGVLANDNDPRSRPLTAVLQSGPGNGTLGLSANGGFTYTPATGYFGPDSFTYRARNGVLDSNIATVNLNVIQMVPVGLINGSFESGFTGWSATGNQSIQSAAPYVATNGTKLVGFNGANLTPNAVLSQSFATAAGGTYTVAFDAGILAFNTSSQTLQVTVTGNTNLLTRTIPMSGTASGGNSRWFPQTFTFVADSTLSVLTFRDQSPATQGLDMLLDNVRVTGPPPAPSNTAPLAADDSYSTPYQTALVIPAAGILSNDSDAQSNPLTAILSAAPASGTLTLSSNGSFTYTPASGFSGSASFTYRANDGILNSNVATVNLTVGPPPNTAPVAAADSYSTPYQTALVVPVAGVLSNDSDAQGNPLTAILSAAPANGTLNLNANGGFSYTPNAGYSGADSFTYRANDGFLNSNLATVNLTVNPPPNTAPVAVADSYSTPYQTILLVPAAGVLSNDADAQSNPLTAVLGTVPSNGTVTLNINGGFTYTPVSGYSGADSFTYRANDGLLNSNVATVNLIINPPPNTAPVAVADTYSTPYQTALVVPVAGVLSNDTDAQSNPLTAILSVGPSNGTLTLNANGSFTYTPASGYSGADSFTYRANDGFLNSNVATVNLTINPPPNTAPVAVADSYSTPYQTILAVPAAGVLSNDTDAQSNPLTASLSAGPSHGTVSLNANGGFTYTPTAGYSGADSFTYRANDGLLNSNIVTVNLTVHPPANIVPVAVADSYSTPYQTVLVVTASGVLANDSDANSNPLTAVLNTGPGHGTLALNPNGGFTYTPANGYSGPDAFSYHANDGSLDSNVVTVSLTINPPPNTAPVAVADSYSTSYQSALVIPAAGVLSNDTDAQSNPLTAVLNAGPSNGTMTLNPNGGFTYTPASGYSGTDSFTYRANDGTLDSNIVSVSLTINPPPNTAPVAVTDSFSTFKNSPLTIASPGVLGNDSDAESNPIAAVLVTSPGNGTLTLNASGGFTYTPNAGYVGADSFSYRASDGTLNSNVATATITINDVVSVALVNGSFESGFTGWTTTGNQNIQSAWPYAPTDGTKLVGFNGANTTPNAVLSQSFATVAGQTYVLAFDVGVLAYNTNSQSIQLTVTGTGSLVSQSITFNGTGTGNNRWIPQIFTFVANSPITTLAFRDQSAFTQALDMTLDNVRVTTGASPSNTAPVAVADSYSTNQNTALVVPATGVLSNDTDAQSNPLTAVLNTGPSSGTVSLNPNGGFTYTPASGYSGPDSFTYRANDGLLNSNIATVTLTVNAVNTAPVATNDSYSTNQGTALVVPAAGVLSNDTDAQSNPLTASLSTGPSHGTLSLNANGGFTYTPTAGYSGPDSFTYRTNDGLLNSSIATVTLTVIAVNTAPVATNDSYSTNQSTMLTVPASGVLANDTDAQSNPLTASVNVGPSNGTLSLNANGGFTYTPNTGYSGADSFTYRANDGLLNSNIATVSLTINPLVPAGLVNGSFESGFNGWTAGGNQVIQSTAPYTATHGTKLVGFNGGNTVPNAVLSQSFTTAAGQTYTLAFDAGVFSHNTSPQTLQVTVNGTGNLLTRTITIFGGGGGSNRWLPQSFTFTANSPTTTLTFRDQSTATNGLDMLLDNVRILNSPAAAPAAAPAPMAAVVSQPTELGPVSLTGTPGNFTIHMNGPAAGTYTLERSNDLVHWERVRDKEANGPSLIEFRESDSAPPASHQGRTFYRIGFVKK